jgi:hypothetical protein
MLRISSIFWLLVGAYVCVHSYDLGLGELSSPGPGFIFFIAGILLFAFSLINFWVTFRIEKEHHKRPVILWSRLKWQNIVIVLAASFAYLFFLPFLGFLLSTFFLMVSLFGILERKRLWLVILAALITSSMSYGVFVLVLKIPFPEGVLGF